MINDKQVIALPVQFIRGKTIDDVLIVEEAQNLTKAEMLAILTRLGKNGRIIINGDNYYKKKEKKDKKDKSEKKEKKEKKEKSETDIDESQLIEGFELLKKMVKSRELYLLLGNHDIKYINGKCETSILEKEIATTDEYNFPNNLTMFKEIGNTLIIMIDTNIYDDENPTCYKDIFDKNKKIDDEILFNEVILNEIDENKNNTIFEYINNKLKTYQSELINEKLNTGKTYTNIIVCGHHPLFGVKMKDGNLKEQKLDKDIYELFFNIKESATNFYYLCSDIHNYQEGEVTININDHSMKIKQYIVGTGGTKLDIDNISVLDYNRQILNNITLNYHINNHSSEYGYIIVNIKDDSITVNHKMISNNSKGGNNIENIKSGKNRKSKKSRKSGKNRKSRNSKYSKKFKSL
jgi:hypothetical protein